MLTVTYPHNCALGGDLAAVVETASGEHLAINATGRSGHNLDVAQLSVTHGDCLPLTGADTITVPGVVSGWAALHHLGATRSWRELITPASQIARQGFPVDGSLLEAIRQNYAAILTDPGMRFVFAPAGSVPRAGEAVVQPALAATLERLAAYGARDFYEGDIAEQLVSGLRAYGVALDMTDMSYHRALVGEPLTHRWRDTDLSTCPPNSQGFVLFELLEILDRLELADPLRADAGTLARAYAVASADRERHLADATYMSRSVTALLADARMDALAQRAKNEVEFAATSVQGSGDTVAILATDDLGNRISILQSVFHSFGAYVVEPSTGILMHNRACGFTLDASSPNAIGPGKHPAHSLAPLLARRGDTSITLGTMGGKAQPQILFQLLVRVLSGESPTVALGAPRWIVGGMEVGEAEDTVHLEEDCDATAAADLSELGCPLVVHDRHSEALGHANLIVHDGSNGVRAASDPRGDGGFNEPGP